MSENDELKRIANTDQISAAIRDCAMHTANHYMYLKSLKLPDELAARLASEFQQTYLATIWGLTIVKRRERG